MAAVLVPITPVVKMSSCACGVLESEVTVPPLEVVVVAMSISRKCSFFIFLESLGIANRTKSRSCTAQVVQERYEAAAGHRRPADGTSAAGRGARVLRGGGKSSPRLSRGSQDKSGERGRQPGAALRMARNRLRVPMWKGLLEKGWMRPCFWGYTDSGIRPFLISV